MILVVHHNILLRHFASASVLLPAPSSWQCDFPWTDEEIGSQTAAGLLKVNGRAGMGPSACLTPNSLPA